MGYNAATRTFDTIADLRLQRGTSNAIVKVSGYYAVGDHGGVSYWWDSASSESDDGCFVINPSVGSGAGRWKLNYNGTVDVKWSGAKGDGISNDTPFVQNIIDNFVVAGPIDNGVSIEFTKGTYLLAGLMIKTGCRLFANQNAKDNFISNVPVTIMPYGNPDYILDCDPTATNWAIENLYLDCDYTNQPQLIAGARLRGTKAYFLGNNVNKAPGHAVYNEAGLIYIEKSSILGMFSPSYTFSGLNDFKGALHMQSIGDSYVYDNEISASLSYFTSTVTPRDPINGRIVAMSFGGAFSGTSVVSGNLFENGDRAVAIGNSLYCTFSHNRYELSAMGGLYIYGPMQFGTFSQERFADNSLSVDGGADDITIATGAAGNIAFVSPIFESLANGAIPNSNYKVNYHISNYGSNLIDLVTPVVDPSYSVNGLINLSAPELLPLRRVKGQYTPDDPQYTSVSTQKLPGVNPAVGYIKLKQGTDASNGSFVGAAEFWTPQDTLAYSIGFSPEQYLSFLGSVANPLFAFAGNLTIQKNGEAKATIWSQDGTNHSSLVFQNFGDVHQQTTLRLNKDTGYFQLLSSGNINVGTSNNWIFEISGYSSIPTLPPLNADGGYKVLVRNDANSRMEYVTGAPANYTFSNTGFDI